MDDDLSTRYAHCEGHTDICYDDIGKYIISSGSDGDIRLYDGFEDDDPQSHNMGDSVSAIAFSNDVLYVATNDKNCVSAYSFPSIEFEEIVAQYNTAVYHIVCSKNGQFVAAGGGDFIIKVFNTSDKSLTALREHEGPILSLSFDPKEKFLASSACDGTVRIWTLSDEKCVKKFDLFKKSNDLCTSPTLCRLDWSPDGQHLAVPVETNINFYQRESWSISFTITDACITKTISIVTYSPFGNYIAAASMNGQMAVWDVKSKRRLSSKPHEKETAVCGFKWNPTGKDLIFTDVEGNMGIYSSPLSSGQDVKKSTPSNQFIDAFADENDDDVEEDENKDIDMDEDNAFDIGAIKASLDPQIFSEDIAMETASVKSEPVVIQTKVVEAPKAPVQTAFQPSSTPVNLEHRFMLWNNIGIVRCYNTEEENSIDVEFHDATVYHPLHLTNTRNYTLAALSSEALLLACPILDGNTSKLECLHFNTWDSNKEWIVEMPEDEEIETVALGDGFAVCITNKRFVRLFSISGIQCEVFWLSGPVVSCTARNNQLVIVYHKGTGIDGDQCLSMMIVKVKLGSPCLIKECPVPLNTKAFLCWLGFTDEGKPCIVDTSGNVSLLNISFGAKWTPVANTVSNLKNKSDTCFVIGLSEIKQEIRYILCKGSRYPALLPRPTISVLQFCLPLCEMSSDKGKLEEENQRYSMAHSSLESLLKEGYDLDSEFSSIEKKWMDTLLKMFVLATKSEREFRALDISHLMPNPAILQGAIRYATQRHRIALAERLGEVMNEMLSQEAEVVDEDLDLLPSEEFAPMMNSSVKDSFNNSLMRDDNALKPKPLARIRNQTERYLDNHDDSLDISGHDTLGIIATTAATTTTNNVSIKSSQTNPFKSSSKLQNKKEESSVQNGIDDILNSSMQNVHAKHSNSSLSEKPKKSRFEITKKSTPVQSANSEKSKTGFNLFLEKNLDDIRAAEAPDMSEKEIVQIAMKLYRELPKSEKQKYLKPSTNKSNSITSHRENSTDMKENTCESQDDDKESSAKRKDDDDSEDIPKPKKIKVGQAKPADATLRKLTQYAFTKTPK